MLRKLILASFLCGCTSTSPVSAEKSEIVCGHPDVSKNDSDNSAEIVATSVSLSETELQRLSKYSSIRLELNDVKIPDGIKVRVYLGATQAHLNWIFYAQNHEEVETTNNPYYLGTITSYTSEIGSFYLDARANLLDLRSELQAGNVPVVLKAVKLRSSDSDSLLKINIKSAKLKFIDQ